MRTSIKTLIGLLLLLPASGFAATAVVEVDTGGRAINALEGTLVLPEGANIHEIQTGASAILMWVERPHQVGNAVVFAGITPGGFEGTYPVFSIDGLFTKEELERAHFESVLALQNDGTGASAPVAMSLSIVASKTDIEPPEAFTPTIASDSTVFDGKYFLVFATQDKGSGIDRYEVREGRWGWFRKAESPYLLDSQKLDKSIYVKAIDNLGNERVAVVPARLHSEWCEDYGLFVILTVIGLVALAYKKIWLRFVR